MPTLYDLPLHTLSGEPTTLAPYRGKVLLIVNTASKCGLTPQYEALEALHNTYKHCGFAVLGFPANDFGGQEPLSAPEIASFCSTNFNVSFPMFEKVVATGPAKAPLYELLTNSQPTAQIANPQFKDDLRGYGLTVLDPPELTWNFEKFLIDRHGKVAARFAPDMTPNDPVLIQAIERALPPVESTPSHMPDHAVAP